MFWFCQCNTVTINTTSNNVFQTHASFKCLPFALAPVAHPASSSKDISVACTVTGWRFLPCRKNFLRKKTWDVARWIGLAQLGFTTPVLDTLDPYTWNLLEKWPLQNRRLDGGFTIDIRYPLINICIADLCIFFLACHCSLTTRCVAWSFFSARLHVAIGIAVLCSC